MVIKNNSNGKFVTTYRCISKLNLKSIVILVHERKKSYKCQICYLFDTVVVKKMTNIENLIWKDMLNWFMRGRNKTTVIIKKVLWTNMLHLFMRRRRNHSNVKFLASVAQQIHKPDKILVNLIEICEGYHDENLQQLRSVVQW